MLDAGDAYVRSLPAQLFELFHLRYLAISYLNAIPAAISKLQNLQTLVILGRDRLRLLGLLMNCLPQEIWRMPQLRHFLFCGRLPEPNGKSSALENLQTLSLVSHSMCTEGILKMIPNLKKLEIDCSDYQDGTHLNNLVHLHQLEILELRSSNAVWRKGEFAFPRMLRKLTLSGLGLPWNEMSVVGSLPNLEVLKLRDHTCYGDRWETSEGEFPWLIFLSVENSNLEHWITGRSHFPSLKWLVLSYCGRLSEIPDVVGEFPLLELIEVDKLNIDLVKSAKMIQEEQQSFGNDFLQVRIGS